MFFITCALIVYGSGDLNKKYTSEQMIKYCVNDESVCRRKLLFEDFTEYTSVGNVCVGCKCCDICQIHCKCGIVTKLSLHSQCKCIAFTLLYETIYAIILSISFLQVA